MVDPQLALAVGAEKMFSRDRDLMRVETSRGGEQTISTAKYEVTGRGGRGRELLQRGQFTRVIPSEVENPPPLAPSS